MKVIPVKEAVGTVLCHDITQIIPGKVKEVAFKKGHIIREEDIPTLLSIGKESIYIWDLDDGFVHEDEAAPRIAKAGADRGSSLAEPKEGKVNFNAKEKGLLKINIKALYELSSAEKLLPMEFRFYREQCLCWPILGTYRW